MKKNIISLSAVTSCIAQIILFFCAVTALTLLYLSYRHDDFLASFVAIGMILTAPWLIISLLPTILVLKDKELRKELLWNQLITMIIAFAILYGISVYIGFDRVILSHAKAYLTSAYNFVPAIAAQLAALIKQAVDVVIIFYKETIAPLFSG